MDIMEAAQKLRGQSYSSRPHVQVITTTTSVVVRLREGLRPKCKLTNCMERKKILIMRHKTLNKNKHDKQT